MSDKRKILSRQFSKKTSLSFSAISGKPDIDGSSVTNCYSNLNHLIKEAGYRTRDFFFSHVEKNGHTKCWADWRK